MSEIPGYRGTSHLLEDAGELAIAALWNRRSLTFPAESHAHCYFAPDRFLRRQTEAADSACGFHPAYPGVIFRQFDARNLDVSWSIRLAHQVDVEASLSEEQSAVSRDRLRWRGRGGPADAPLCRLHRKAAAGHFSRTGRARRSCIWRGSYPV
jgi:hypothetical protein